MAILLVGAFAQCWYISAMTRLSDMIMVVAYITLAIVAV